MFDFAWSEIALIGVVALVAIGPKDMPVAVKTLSDLVKKARRMAGEFQTHVDEMVRDADLGDVREHIRDIRSLNIRGTIAKAVDGDGSIRRAFTENPLQAPTASVAQAGAYADPPAVIGLPDQAAATASLEALRAPTLPAAAAPSFIPPGVAATVPMPVPAVVPPPSFIPPAAAARAEPSVPAAPAG